jgi:hypothetical protein
MLPKSYHHLHPLLKTKSFFINIYDEDNSLDIFDIGPLSTNRAINHFVSHFANQNDKVQFEPSHVGHGQNNLSRLTRSILYLN